MSFYRFIYYCALVGGWCAFVGWLLPEMTIPKSMKNTLLHDVLAAGFVGAGIGAGLMILTGTGKQQRVLRLIVGLVGGMIAGAIGGSLGNMFVDKLHLPRWLGWTMMGLCIGSIEGAYECSLKKLRNGLIGGSLGGLVGGLLFEPIANLVQTGHFFTSRAAGFVILGLAIGCLIGLVQVVLREAWLTVIDGYRPGRQVILSQPVTLLGRGEWVALPFMGSFGNALDMEHLKIIRQADGSFAAEDNDTKNGSEVNRQKIDGPTPLQDGDTIKIGNNIIRFNEKTRKEAGKRESRDKEPAARQATRSGMAPVAPAPPPPPRPATAPPPPPSRPEVKSPSAPVDANVELKTPAPPPPARSEGKPPPPPPPPTSPTSPTTPEVKAPPPAPSAKSEVKAPPPPPPGASSDDACPSCKRKVPGKKGTRYCMVCDITF